MDPEKEISIKVNIGDRIYPLKIKAKEEEFVREAAKSVNDKLKRYRNHFEVNGKEDLLAMCALEGWTEVSRLSSAGRVEDNEITNKIAEIKSLITSSEKA